MEAKEPHVKEEAKQERKVFKPASLRARERGTDPKQLITEERK